MGRDPAGPAERAVRGGVAGALWAIGALVGAPLSDGRVLAGVARELLLAAPGWAATLAIELLGGAAKSALLGAVALAAIALAAAASVVWPRYFGPAARGPATAAAAAATGFLLLAFGASISWGWLLATAVAVGPAAVVARAGRGAGTAGRRSFLRRAGLAAGALAGVGSIGFVASRLGGDGEASPLAEKRDAGRTVGEMPRAGGDGRFNFGEMPTAITPVRDHYVVDINYQNPEPDEGWTLDVGGAVSEPLSLDREALRTHEAAVTRTVTMVCISNPVGGPLISTARWRGVPLSALLDEAGVEGGATDVVTRALDGYSEAIPVEFAREEEILVAVGMNGRALPAAHGRPARLLIPGRYGMKSTKWLTSIELSETEHDSYWESRGWVEEGEINTLSCVRTAVREGSRVVVGGVAYAGGRGIERVEVSVDGGDTWAEAELEARESPHALRRWRREFEMSAPGRFEAVVRAVDGTGALQTSEESDPHPGGSTGWHRKTFRR